VASKIFIGTVYPLALANGNDEYQREAVSLSHKYENSSFIITDTVLLEIGNALARNFKKQAIQIIENFRSSVNVEIVHLNSDLFNRAFQYFKTRLDKTWTLVDCISFEVMKEKGITDVLTVDRHFEQAGFNRLMKEK